MGGWVFTAIEQTNIDDILKQMMSSSMTKEVSFISIPSQGNWRTLMKNL